MTVDCSRRQQSTVNRQHHSGVTGNDINSSRKEHWQDGDAQTAEVLLPEDFPVEAKALKQLANLANGSIFNADYSGFCDAKLVGGTAAQSNCFLFESGFAD